MRGRTGCHGILCCSRPRGGRDAIPLARRRTARIGSDWIGSGWAPTIVLFSFHFSLCFVLRGVLLAAPDLSPAATCRLPPPPPGRAAAGTAGPLVDLGGLEDPSALTSCMVNTHTAHARTHSHLTPPNRRDASTTLCRHRPWGCNRHLLFHCLATAFSLPSIASTTLCRHRPWGCNRHLLFHCLATAFSLPSIDLPLPSVDLSLPSVDLSLPFTACHRPPFHCLPFVATHCPFPLPSIVLFHCLPSSPLSAAFSGAGRDPNRRGRRFLQARCVKPHSVRGNRRDHGIRGGQSNFL